MAPTILDFLHIPLPPSFEGVSLLPGHGARTEYGESVYPGELRMGRLAVSAIGPLQVHRCAQSGALRSLERPRRADEYRAFASAKRRGR